METQLLQSYNAESSVGSLNIALMNLHQRKGEDLNCGYYLISFLFKEPANQIRNASIDKPKQETYNC